MGQVIYRGSTATITMRPPTGLSVSSMGTPKIVITQELVYLEPTVTVQSASNSISCKLTEEQSLQLVAGAVTEVQQMWKDGNGNITRFPVHKISVERSLAEEFDPVYPPDPEPEPALNIRTITETDEPDIQQDVDPPDEAPDVDPGVAEESEE